MVVGTTTKDDVVAVAKAQVGTIAEMVLSAWAAASNSVAPANARLGIGGTEMEWVG